VKVNGVLRNIRFQRIWQVMQLRQFESFHIKMFLNVIFICITIHFLFGLSSLINELCKTSKN
jgi:hypothetical protein